MTHSGRDASIPSPHRSPSSRYFEYTSRSRTQRRLIILPCIVTYLKALKPSQRLLTSRTRMSTPLRRHTAKSRTYWKFKHHGDLTLIYARQYTLYHVQISRHAERKNGRNRSTSLFTPGGHESNIGAFTVKRDCRAVRRCSLDKLGADAGLSAAVRLGSRPVRIREAQASRLVGPHNGEKASSSKWYGGTLNMILKKAGIT